MRADRFGVAAKGREDMHHHPPARRRHVNPMRDAACGSHPQIPQLPLEMPDMRCTESLQPDIFHRLEQPQRTTGRATISASAADTVSTVHPICVIWRIRYKGTSDLEGYMHKCPIDC